MLIVPEFL